MISQKLSRIFDLFSTIIIFLLISTFISGCDLSINETPREISVNNVQAGLSTPMQPQIFGTSDPGYITVRGVLVVLDPMTMIPAHDDGVYLVPLPSDQSTTEIPQFDVGTVPQAEVDEVVGEFVFTNIEPGQYAVVVLTAGGSQIPVRYSDTGNYAIITFDSSQLNTTVDMGRLTLP
jgi:hypothetical protein